MKNRFLLLLALLVGFCGGPQAKAQMTDSHSFTNLNQSIPDGNAAGMHDVRDVTSPIVKLSALRLRLRVVGEFNGDLYGYVRHIQAGITNFCVLLNRPGRTAANPAGYSDGGLDVVFDDSASRDIHLYRAVTNLPAGAALRGAWQPDGRNVDPDQVLDTTSRTTTLSSFCRADANGEWTLFLADLANGGTNLLSNWELDFTGAAIPTVTWPTPADIIYGTVLGAAQLNASSPVPGTFVYSPPPATVLNSGSNQLLSVTFTPADTNSYVVVTTNVTLNVLKQVLIITAQNTNKLYGTPIPPLTACCSGFVNGDTTNCLSAQAAVSTTATANSPVDSYPINASGASGSNYAIAYAAGSLTISPAACSGLLTSSANPALPSQLLTFTMALTAVAPGAGTPGGAVQFKIDGANAGAPVSLSGGSASYSRASLAHGSHDIGAEYAGDGNFTGATKVLPVAQVINTPPIAGAVTLLRDSTSGTKVSVGTLLSGCTDADGDPITLISVSPVSANAGAIVVTNDWVFYTPAPGFTNTDTFSYTISDGWVLAAGVVTLNIRVDNGPSPSLTITGLGNGAFSISGDGIPGRTYRIQSADAASSTNWLILGLAPADEYGIFQFIDSNGPPQQFYRSVYP